MGFLWKFSWVSLGFLWDFFDYCELGADHAQELLFLFQPAT